MTQQRRIRNLHVSFLRLVLVALLLSGLPLTSARNNNKEKQNDKNKQNNKDDKQNDKNKQNNKDDKNNQNFQDESKQNNKDDKDENNQNKGDNEKQDKDDNDKKDKDDKDKGGGNNNNNNNNNVDQNPDDVPSGGAMAAQCTLCADGSEPDFFLSNRDLGMGCDELSNLAKTLPQGDRGCSALQVIGYQSCACPTYPDGYCTLCLGGFFDIPNPDQQVSSTCGYTCKDLLFVEESALSTGCKSLQPFQKLCGCPSVAKSCPVCDNSAQDFHRYKMYKEYGLTCQDLGMARDMGLSSSCVEIQMKFRYFCGCPGATPECTLCQQAQEEPKEPDKKIPLLDTTCGEVNDYASLHSKSECATELGSMGYNAAGYCGCSYNGPLLQCDFCEKGTKVRDRNKVPTDSEDGSTCGELEEFAKYVWTPTEICTGVQSFAEECCS